MNLHDLPNCHLPKEQHEKRQKSHIDQGTMMKESVRNWDFDEPLNAMSAKPMTGLEDPPMACLYKDMPFGPVNTVELAGCLCFVSYYVLRDFDAVNFSFEEWVEEVVKQGYRSWKFRDYAGSFASPEVDVEEVKQRFFGKVDLADCKTAEELIAKLGTLEGIGGNMFLMDNIISIMSEPNGLKPVEETRLTSIEEIIDRLKNGLYVPMRVNNSIYHDDPMRAGGHYVCLYGIEDGVAQVWDSSIGDVEIPFKRLMESAIADDKLIAVWDLYY